MENNLEQELASVLAKYEKSDEPTSITAPPQPQTLDFGGQKFTVNNLGDAQQVINNQLQNVSAYVSQLKQQMADYERQMTELKTQPKPQVKVDDAPKPLVDPGEYVQGIINDPLSANKPVLEKLLDDPEFANKLWEKSPQAQQFKMEMEVRKFTEAHPLYNHPQLVQGLAQLCKERGLPINAGTMEMASTYLVANGLLPSEAMLRQQQQQAFVQQFGIPQNPQYQQQVPQNQQFRPQTNNQPGFLQGQPAGNHRPYQPPPMMGSNSQGNAPSMVERIQNAFNAKNLTADQMKEMLAVAERNGLG